MTELDIRAGSAKYKYSIGSGLLSAVGSVVAALHTPCRAALITDENIDGLYSDMVRDSLADAGFEVYKQTIADGEVSKSPAVLWDILGGFARQGIGRSDIVVALGGGVTGDTAGFASAIYMRGIDYIQLPTTLLAAVDSAIGGKTAIDLPQGKNLAGAFHQPLAVICDTDTLLSLPQSVLAQGAAEVIKYGMLGAKELLEVSPEMLLRESERIISRCACIKAALVNADERDTGERRLLNFGHSFAHAMELLSGYTLPHGEAVARGMALAAGAAWRLGLSDEDCFPIIAEALGRFGLEGSSPYSAAELARAMMSDKKRSGESITLVLPKRIGECYLRPTPTEALEAFCKAGIQP